MEEVKIVAVQYKSILGDLRKNVRKIEAIVKNIMKEEPDTRLIVFPELALSGYNCFNDMKYIAETIEGEGINSICKIANEAGVALVVGYPERDTYEDKIYNSLIYVNKDGTIEGNYRKKNLLHNEKKVFCPGRSYKVIKTEFGRLGLLLGWDMIFSMPSKYYKEEGTDFLIVSSAWEKLYSNQWNFNIKNRAEENSCAVIGVNTIGSFGDVNFLGKTIFVNYKGNLIKSCEDKEDSYISYRFKVKSMYSRNMSNESCLEEFSGEEYMDDIMEI